MTKYLGIDLGTSAVKVILATESGEIIDTATCSYPLLTPQTGWAEQNPEDWYNATVDCLKMLGANNNLGEIVGLSFSGQMHGMVCLDNNGNVLRPAILWNDQRTVNEVDFLNNDVGRDTLLNYTGNIAVAGFTAPKILWLYNNERENFNKTAKYLLPKDYLIYKITGQYFTDVTDASGTLYFDTQNRCWSKDMLSILHINENQLPTVVESTCVVGCVSNEFSEISGLSTSTKVIAGGGDQAVGAVGTGTVNNQSVSISLGTSGVLFICSDNFNNKNNGSMHNFCHANGKYHLMGVTLSAAGSLEWWTNIINNKDYDSLRDGLEDVSTDNLLFLPYLSGERSPINDSNAQGILYGLNVSHTQQHITKAIHEGVCLSLLDCLLVANNAGIYPTKARCIGGGAKSEFWLQMLSDILGIEIATINTADGCALGAVILATVGCGAYATVEEACSTIVKESKVFYPNTIKTKMYKQKYIKYKMLYEATKNI